MAKITNVVLVHGAWADGTAWSKVIPKLLASGLNPVAVQLPLTSLADDVAVVKRAVELLEGPVMLVGHSYGGVVITEAGLESKVERLLYVAGFAPDSGESAGGLLASAPPTPLATGLAPDAYGFLKLTKDGVFNGFAQDLSEAEKTMILVTQAPTSGACLGAEIKEPAWRPKDSWYIVAKNDHAIPPDLERMFAKRMEAETIEVEASHVPMLSKPDEVGKFIVRAAG
jgi:pimeloyl-ACP methyl ester carboxylesterase